MSEFNEPWTSNHDGTAIFDATPEHGDCIYASTKCIGVAREIPLTKEQVERVVCCVNFLAGITTESLNALAKDGSHAAILEIIRSEAELKERWPRRVMRNKAEVIAEYNLPPDFFKDKA